MIKVLFLDCVFNEPLLAKLKKVGIDITPGANYTEDELVKILHDYDCFVCREKNKCTRKIIENNKHLKLITFLGTGYQQYVDVDAARENHIPVSYAPGANAKAVAEYTVALILDAAKKITYSNNQVKNGIWDKTETIDLEGKTLGVVGMGQIGSTVAKILCDGFGMKLIYNSIYSIPEIDDKYNTTMVALEEIFKKADIISLNATCTEENREMVKKAQLDLMKPGAILVNTARQQLVKKADLYDAIINGNLNFVAMDGFYEEPISKDNEFLKLPDDKFIITPHNAYNSANAIQRLELMLIESLSDVLCGREIRHLVPSQ